MGLLPAVEIGAMSNAGLSFRAWADLSNETAMQSSDYRTLGAFCVVARLLKAPLLAALGRARTSPRAGFRDAWQRTSFCRSLKSSMFAAMPLADLKVTEFRGLRRQSLAFLWPPLTFFSGGSQRIRRSERSNVSLRWIIL